MSKRYLLIAPDGQPFGPVDVETLNEWIQDDRLVPTSILIPEGSSVRVAANQVPGLKWKDGQTFSAYSVQDGIGTANDLRMAIVCLAFGVLCSCVRFGLPIISGAFGIWFSIRAIKGGLRPAGIALLVLNIMMVALGVLSLVFSSMFVSNLDGVTGLPKGVLDPLRESKGQSRGGF